MPSGKSPLVWNTYRDKELENGTFYKPVGFSVHGGMDPGSGGLWASADKDLHPGADYPFYQYFRKPDQRRGAGEYAMDAGFVSRSRNRSPILSGESPHPRIP